MSKGLRFMVLLYPFYPAHPAYPVIFSRSCYRLL